LLGGTGEGHEQRGRSFAHQTISASLGQGHIHRDSAYFGNSSLAAEKVDVLLAGAMPAFAKHPGSPGVQLERLVKPE
jgi:hypothetical protein